jgi:hypothetical protein
MRRKIHQEGTMSEPSDFMSSGDHAVMEGSSWRFGSDRVRRKGDRIEVHAAMEMHEWELREKRKTAILIGEEAWCLAGKEITPGGIRYILVPWPEYLHQIPGRRIRYDAAYVKARDEAAIRNQRRVILARVLTHFRIFIGFLPSPLKARIEETCGISARNATFISIMIELFLFFAVGALAVVFDVASMFESALSCKPSMGFISPVTACVAITLLLFLDVTVRYGSYWRQDQSPWGFCEWMFRRRQSGTCHN